MESITKKDPKGGQKVSAIVADKKCKNKKNINTYTHTYAQGFCHTNTPPP
tara:strand:+ start:276 stop:425 length:150 start_codon:yes stop_codon:yes gene_type:complete